MKFRIRVERDASDEIEQAYLWIFEQSPAGAMRWRQRLDEKLQTLTANPGRCPLAPEDDTSDVEVREILFGKRGGVYRILFTIEDDTVSVLHVRHAARRNLGEQE